MTPIAVLLPAANKSERNAIQRDLASKDGQVRSLAVIVPVDLGRLAELQEQMRADEQRLTRIREEMILLRSEQIQPDDVKAALTEFDRLWDALTPRKQSRVLQLLIESVAYDGAEGTVAVTLLPHTSSAFFPTAQGPPADDPSQPRST